MTTLLGIALLVALLVAVARMQRGADRARDAEAQATIDEAKRTGAHEPLMQHPQIDPVRCIGCGSCAAVCPEGDVLGVVEGTAVIVNGAACIGHGRCAEACPVGAITVGLGKIAERDDIPTLDESQESTVEGLFLVGEVTGIALIRHAIGHGVRAVETIAERLGRGGESTPTPQPRRDPLAERSAALSAARSASGDSNSDSEDIVDVAIVGAGPAGLAAALKAVECGLSHVLLDQDEAGGTILHYPRQKLVMTQPVILPLYGKLTSHEYRKEELVEVWRDVLERFPIRFTSGARLTSIDPGDDSTSTRNVNRLFRLETTGGPHVARNVILALGRRGTPRKLGVPGEEKEKVAYRLVDAGLYTNNHLLVVGGGDSAVEAALGLAEQPGNTVTLSYRKEAFFRIKPRNRTKLDEAAKSGKLALVMSSNVCEIRDDAVTMTVKRDGIEGEETREIPNDFVFVFAGAIPPMDLLRGAGIGFGGERPATARPAAVGN